MPILHMLLRSRLVTQTPTTTILIFRCVFVCVLLQFSSPISFAFFPSFLQIAKMFAKYNARFDFTALELTDSGSCGSRPVELVAQTIQAAKQAGTGK
jgi:hypothetical protein